MVLRMQNKIPSFNIALAAITPSCRISHRHTSASCNPVGSLFLPMHPLPTRITAVQRIAAPDEQHLTRQTSMNPAAYLITGAEVGD